jgi:ATP-dependent DNA helicase RecG
MNVQDSINQLKGVGPKTENLLNKCGIYTVMDLLLYLPRSYDTIYLCNSINNGDTRNKIIVKCEFTKFSSDIRTKTGKILTTLIFKNDDKPFKCRWFNQPYIKNKFIMGQNYTLCGRIEEYKGERMLINPSVLNDPHNDEPTAPRNKIIPIYPLKDGITNNLMIKLISGILENIVIKENFPQWIIKKYYLCSLDYAVRNIHSPESINNLNASIRRLKFQELFTFSLKIRMLKEYMSESHDGISFKISNDLVDLKNKLPYALTSAQSRAIKEILMDEKLSKPMNRLLQGDVGSGKTIVAFIAMFNVIKNGYQAVLVAPTEILAMQHFKEAVKLFSSFGIRIELLTGNVSNKCKEKIKSSIKNGDVDLIIGTHALFEQDVNFNNLGMVVTDEQHRFGVMQRSKLFCKGKNIDILVMTATPIPRTLTLYLYGDLNVSVIDELPPHRTKIKTRYIDKAMKNQAYEFALKQISLGRQVYLVCPLVEENEELDISSVTKLYEELKRNYFQNVKAEILFGKMPSKDKEKIMEDFSSGKIQVLISTTVIEVGINVPNATLMIIENAERFGLAQLHQLRGRVGRGTYESYCILIADIKNELIRKRMDIISSSTDGFFIAEQDLKLRGSGDIFGYRQHGEDGLLIADVVTDFEILKSAVEESENLLRSNDKDDINIKNEILNKIEQTSRFICFN